MLPFNTKKFRLGLRSQVIRVVVAALFGSLLVPVLGITTPQSLPTAAAAVSNGSIALSSGGAGRISFATAIPSNQGLTMEAWIRFTTIASANSIFASCANVAATDNCPTWFQETQLYYLNTGKFRIQMPGGPGWCEVNTGRTINANRWTHFALVVPAQTVNQSTTVTVYVNGSAAGTCTGTPTATGQNYRGVVIGGSGNSATPNQINIGPTRISKIVRYSTSFTAPQTFPTSGDANTWAVTNTSIDTDDSSSCTGLSDPNNKTLTFTTFASYQLNNFMTAPTGGGRGGDGTATVTCSSAAPPPLIVSCSGNGHVEVESAISTTNVGCAGSVDLSTSGITTLNGTFNNSPNVTVVKLPNTLQIISNNAFVNTGIAKLVLPPSITSICEGCIASNAQLTSVEMSGSPSVPVTYGNRTFQNNAVLERVSFGYSADASVNLTSYTSSATFMFQGNPRLTVVNSCAAPDSYLATFLAGVNESDTANPKRVNTFNGTFNPTVGCDSGDPITGGGTTNVGGGSFPIIGSFTASVSGTTVTLTSGNITQTQEGLQAKEWRMSTDNYTWSTICYFDTDSQLPRDCVKTGLSVGETYYFRFLQRSFRDRNQFYDPNITVTIPPASTVATLSNLTLSSGTLSPAFSSGTENYTATVDNSVATGYVVTPTKTESGATTVQYLGATGTTTFTGALAVGSNVIRTVVTAPDNVTTKTYTVTVTRPGSSVSTLLGLTLSAGALSPTFASGTTSYALSVANSVSSTTVTPTRTQANATITVNGTSVNSGSASGAISLSVGPNNINVVVTAQDGVTTSTYTVTVTRANSNIATLSALALSSGSLSPTFASGTTSYTTSVANSITSITVTPTRTEANATTVQYLGATGTTPFSGALAVGSNVIRTVVTAQDGTTTITYTVTVTRAASNVATLSALDLSTGTLSPTFASGTTSYTTSVANSITSITVTPTRTEANATTVQYLGATGTTPFSGALAVGSNVIRTVVTAQDGTTTSTYTVTVTRISTDATLLALTLSAGSLSPTFASGTTSYTASVANSVTSITVTPTRTQANATITVNGTSVNSGSASGAISLSVGSNAVNVVVTAQDGVTTSTYTINVTRAVSSVATLSAIGLSSGTLSPTFASGTTSYTASVANSVSSGYTVTPTRTEANATTVQYLGASGTNLFTGDLAIGPNVIRTVVTAQDGTTTITYTVTVTRAATTITTANVVITAPVSGATPQTSTSSNGQFTTTITWSPSATTFAGATAYTAQVTVVADSGFTLTGVSANFFTINGLAATSANLANAGVLTYLFPATAPVAITTTNVVITAPVAGATPQTSTTSNGQFTTTITWSPSATTFASYTVYTANVTVVPVAGRTLTGVAANFFTLNGSAATTPNTADAGVFSYQFARTAFTGGTVVCTTGSFNITSATIFMDGTNNANRSCAGTAVIPEGVRTLDFGSFSNLTGLTSVQLPSTLVNINTSAFAGSGLTSINIPSSVTSVAGQAFQNCLSLRNVTVTGNESVQTNISANAFIDTSLDSLVLGVGTGKIGIFVGSLNALRITSLTLGAGITTILANTLSRPNDRPQDVQIVNFFNYSTVSLTGTGFDKLLPQFSLSSSSANISTGTAFTGYSITGATRNVNGLAPTSYSISPALSSGLNFDTATGLISGTPTVGAVTTEYTITGTNGNNERTATFTLTIATTPAPTITNLDQTLPNYGTTVNVTGTNFTGATVVKIGNTPVATFTVVSATSLSFVVNSPCCTESTISITTPGGTVTSVATITPQPQLAVIATQPVAVSRNVDQSVTFTVVVTAPLDGGVLSYQWIKGATPIQGATSATLTFTPTAVSQAGNYYVAVYNTVSGSTSLRASNTAVLTLNKATPVLSSFAAVNKTFGDAPFTITAPTSSVAGSFSYQSGTTSVATVNGSTITIVGQGSSVITANFVPQNTDDYVSNVTITMTLTVAARQLATPAVPTVVVTSGTLKSFTVSWNAVSNAVAYALKIYAANGVTLLRTVSGLSGTSKLINATDFPAIADGTEYKIGLVATGDANNAESAQSVLASVTTNAQYTITYNSTNSTSGTAPAAATFITGSSPHLISTNTGNLARTSFSFSGWNTAADGSGTTYLATGLVPVSPTANLVLHPRWIALKFTVTYYGNNNTGGTVPTDGAEYLNGASVTVLGFGTLVRRGYNFTGWTTDAANTSAVIAAASTRTINLASLELYAKWEKVPYTVRYNTQGGSTVSNGSYKVGESITLPASPTRAGHTFNGWFANSTGGTALSSTYSPPAVVTNWSLIYQTTQPFRTSGAYVYTSGYGLGNTDAAKTLMDAGRTFNKVRYRMEATYNGTAYYADVSFDKWSGGGTPSSVTPTIDKLAIPGSIADAVQTNVTGCVIDSNWPGFTNVASSVTKGTGKTCGLEIWFQEYGHGSNGSHDEFDNRSAVGSYGSFQLHNVTYGEIQTVLAWNNHGSATNNPDLGFGRRLGATHSDWTFAGKTNFNLATWKLQIYIDDATVAPTEPAIENIDLYAQWTPIQYTVAYNGNLSGGGSAPVDSATYINGSSITVLGNTGALTRTGYTFANWALSADGTGTVYAAGSTLPVGTSNVTFYARWIAIPYSVTYNATSSTGGSAPTDTSTYTIGQNVPVRGNPGSLVRTGYTFSGWTDNSGGSGTVYQSGNNYLVGSANISFHPKWTANNYTITYNKNGASGLPAAATSTFTTDGNPVTLTSVGTMTKTGFNFGGWSTTSTGSAISGTYTTTSDVTLYAVWTIKSLTVTYSEGSANRASLTGFPSNTSGNYGTTITLNATISALTVIDSAQHAFMGWSDGNSVYQGGSSYLLGETSPTFTALWAKIFAVRYSFNGGTPAALTSDIDPECLAAGNTCTDGQVITANAAPTRTGYTFAGWVDQNNVAVVGSTFTVASNRYLLYATWTPENYAITYNTAGGSTPEATFTKQLGQSFTVAAAPTKTGHTFTGWSDGTTIVNPGVTYNVSTSPVTLTAQWSTDVYTVSYDPNGGSGSAIANVSYTFGANAISLPTVGDLTRSNFTFAGWSETPTGTSVGATYTPTISRTLYVVWTVSQYLVTYSGNGGTPSAASATYSAGSSPLVLPTATRANFTFQGWYSAATDGVLLGLAGATYAPASATTIYARWIQDSLIGVPASSLSFISSYAVNPAITATNTFSTSDSAVSLRVPAGSLPAGTTVTNWLLSSDEYARALLPGQNNYLLSLVVSWLNNDGTVPVAPDSNPLVMTITNSSIKAGARVYSVVGNNTQLLGVATQDGSVSVNLTTDPQIYVLQTRPAAPTNVTATSGEQSSSFVSWSASADDGGSAIINYTVTASDGQRCISATTSCNFGGLTNGASYTFTVYASNGVGDSDPSTASASIMPGTAPAVIVPNPPSTPEATTPSVTTPAATTPVVQVVRVPVRAAYVATQIAPQISKSADKLICTSGTYSSGFTLDGVVEPGSTSVFTPTSYIYNLLFNLVIQSPLSVTTAKTSASWDLKVAPAGVLVTCTVTVTNTSSTVTESSFQNTAATSAAVAAQNKSIAQAESDYKAALVKNSKNYQKALIDNRTKWRADTAKSRAEYNAELARIKKLGATKSRSALTSAALQKLDATNKKLTADYKASGPASIKARELADKAALDAKNAAIAKANSNYSSVIESLGFAVRAA